MTRLNEELARALYTLVAISMMPILVGYLLWRSWRQPDYLRFWSERFLGTPLGAIRQTGHPFAGGAKKIYWLHAVSVGETRAAAPLIAHWFLHEPDCGVVLTHTTPTGRQTGAELFTRYPRLVQCYLPYDYPWAVNLFLAWARPDLGVLMETELWPNLIAAAHARKIPLVLVNARLSARSAQRLLKYKALAAPALRRLTAIAAQTESDAKGFHAVLQTHTPPVHVVGNMKFDVRLSEDQLQQGAAWRAAWPHQRVWLAASTRDDEEAAILDAWAGVAKRSDALLIIVPRHPQRFDRVAKIITDRGFKMVRRSALTTVTAETDVFLGDSLGEMFAYLNASDLVLIGGSLPALGGQNPIEACAVGRPVFFGPHMFNFAQIARALQQVGAGREIQQAADWFTIGQELLADPEALARAGAAARSFALTHRGATERTQSLLEAISPAVR